MPKSKNFDTAINLLCLTAFLFVSITVIGVAIFASGSDSNVELEARSSDPQESLGLTEPTVDSNTSQLNLKFNSSTQSLTDDEFEF